MYHGSLNVISIIENVTRINIWNNDKYRCECYVQKKYLASITDDSGITFDEIIETTNTVPTKTVLTKSTSTNFYVLLNFLLITVAVSIS